jgi:hypothetical protein
MHLRRSFDSQLMFPVRTCERRHPWRRIGAITFIGLVTAVGPVFAQPPQASQPSQDVAPLPAQTISAREPLFLVADSSRLAAQSRRELERWTAEYTAWQQWMEKWTNRGEPGWFTQRERRPKPDPPEWLAAACDTLVDDDPPLARACALRAEWADDAVTAFVRRQNAASSVQTETQAKTSWWEYVHLDALWPIFRQDAVAYGVVGTHATMDVAGRFEIFVAPGVIMLNLPAGNGRQWTAATDWGLAYKLGTFRLPGSSQSASLHINFAKAWVFAGAGGFANGSIDLAGLSVTFAR